MSGFFDDLVLLYLVSKAENYIMRRTDDLSTSSLPPRQTMLCRHCHSHPQHRPGKLCVRCYEDHSIRENYVSTCARGHGLSDEAKKLPKPTTALPGTPEKLLVLEERARLGQALWHPDDAQWASRGTAMPVEQYCDDDYD
jgi:hypothetical protein